jgi:hypothetical protein
VLEARLDDEGFVRSARTTRTGSFDRHTVELEALPLPHDGVPIVLLELLTRVRPAGRRAVRFVDLASGEHHDGSVEPRGDDVVAHDASGAVLAFTRAARRGQVGPGGFVEEPLLESESASQACAALSPKLERRPRKLLLEGLADALASLTLSGPGQRVDTQDARGPILAFDASFVDVTPPQRADRIGTPLLEVDDPRVLAFARARAAGLDPLEDARKIVEAVHDRVDPARTDVPPTAVAMLEHGGDCDVAAALVVASLRALGHAARPVVGMKLHDGALVPHAWAEVYTSNGWTMADATLPAVGVLSTHVKLAAGTGSALNMGRVLGRMVPVVVEE